MDIVTHALMGAVIASPVLPTAPLTAACFVLGSVLPDLDALSRCFGKRAFLRWHQTYTHALPMIACIGALAWMVIPAWAGEQWAALALVAGMLLHVGLDLSNTYGTAVLSPLSSRRWCAEWVFFIDGVVVLLSVGAALAQWIAATVAGVASMGVAAVYGIVLAAYWILKAALRARAGRFSPAGTVSLLPSAFVPWRYFGCARDEDCVCLFRINAINGHVDQESRQPVYDADFSDALAAVPEYRIMRHLSPAYHVVSATQAPEGTELTCRDLRTRNFGGRFGELVAVVDPDGRIVRRELNV